MSVEEREHRATGERGVTGAGDAAAPGRLRDVDALRGFALWGIVLANVQIMAGPHAAGTEPGASAPDEVAAWLVTALVRGKFYLLFAFLFGYSFTLQARSATRAGSGFAARHLRRSLCLWAIGLGHAVLLFPGDILMTYAALGLVLFAARGMAPRGAVRAAVWLTVGLGVVLLALELLTAGAAPQDAAAAVGEGVGGYRGGPLSVVHANLREWRELLAGELLYAPHVLAASLMGLAAGKREVLAAPGPQHARMKRLLAYGLPVGLAGGVFAALCGNGPLDPRWSLVGAAVNVLTAPALTAAYGCGLLLLLRTRPGRWIGDVLASAGRMALTNYLTQSLVMALVFTGYGLGQYGRWGTAAVAAGSLALFVAQLALSHRLLGPPRRGYGAPNGCRPSRGPRSPRGPRLREVPRFRYGPVEWLLHTVTRGRGG